jgi:hypothetical protein
VAQFNARSVAERTLEACLRWVWLSGWGWSPVGAVVDVFAMGGSIPEEKLGQFAP